MRIILILFGIAILGFVATAYIYGSFLFWEPKFEDARRQVFENTKSFRDGSSRDLDNLRVAYMQAKTPEEKAVIKDTIRHRVFGIPPEQVSPSIQQIINSGE